MQHLQTELSINRSEHAKLLDDFVELRHVNSNLMKVVDGQAEAICKLEVELDNLDQYSRRENAYFTGCIAMRLLKEQIPVDVQGVPRLVSKF